MGERKVDNSPGVFLDINVFFTIFPGTQSLQVLLLLPLLAPSSFLHIHHFPNKKHLYLLPTVKFIVISAISVLSALALGLTLHGLTPRGAHIRPTTQL